MHRRTDHNRPPAGPLHHGFGTVQEKQKENAPISAVAELLLDCPTRLVLLVFSSFSPRFR